MRKVISVSVLFLLCISSFAQKIQFSDNTNTWSTLDSTVGCCLIIPPNYTTAHYDSNTYTYNGYTYQVLISSIATVLTREDAGRVYVIGTTDSIERVLYDFNLALNDTTHTSYPQDIYIAWVTQIDSTQIGGNWYKVWHFEGTDSVLYYTDSVRPISYNVIEGIGCTNGVYYPANAYNHASFVQYLLCFSNDLGITTGLSNPIASYGDGYIGSYFDNDSSCSQFYANHVHAIHGVRVQQVSQKNRSVSVIPNPTNETSKIIFSNNIRSGNVIVLNAFGQVVINIPFQNKEEVLIGDQIKVPGTYFYHVTDNESEEVFSGKFAHQ